MKQLKSIVPSNVPATALRPKDIRYIVDQFTVQYGLSKSTAKKRHLVLRML